MYGLYNNTQMGTSRPPFFSQKTWNGYYILWRTMGHANFDIFMPHGVRMLRKKIKNITTPWFAPINIHPRTESLVSLGKINIYESTRSSIFLICYFRTWLFPRGVTYRKSRTACPTGKKSTISTLPVLEFSTPFPNGKKPAMYTSCLLLSMLGFCRELSFSNNNRTSTLSQTIFTLFGRK